MAPAIGWAVSLDQGVLTAVPYELHSHSITVSCSKIAEMDASMISFPCMSSSSVKLPGKPALLNKFPGVTRTYQVPPAFPALLGNFPGVSPTSDQVPGVPRISDQVP